MLNPTTNGYRTSTNVAGTGGGTIVLAYLVGMWLPEIPTEVALAGGSMLTTALAWIVARITPVVARFTG